MATSLERAVSAQQVQVAAPSLAGFTVRFRHLFTLAEKRATVELQSEEQRTVRQVKLINRK